MSLNNGFRLPIFLDCDPGEDDALAILYALAENHPVRALICGFGNTSPQNTICNGAGLLSLAQRADVALFKGAQKPFRPHPIESENVDAGDFVGANGMCGVDLPNTLDIKPRNAESHDAAALQQIANYVRDQGPLTYIVTGPCATLAHILDILGDKAPQFIKQIIVMGGALDAGGNHGPINPETGKSYAEFNFYCDPHGTKRVIESGIPVTLAAWDLTEQIVLGYDALIAKSAKGTVGDFVFTLMKNFLESYGIDNKRDFEFNDCITLSAYEGKGTLREETIAVITEGKQAGRIVRDKNGTTVKFIDLDDAQKIAVRDAILESLGVA